MKIRFLTLVLFWGVSTVFIVFFSSGCMMAPAVMGLKNPEKIFKAPIEDVRLAVTITLDNFGLIYTEENREGKEQTLNAHLANGSELTIQLQPLGNNLTKVNASTGYFKDDKVMIQKLFDDIDQNIKTIRFES